MTILQSCASIMLLFWNILISSATISPLLPPWGIFSQIILLFTSSDFTSCTYRWLFVSFSLGFSSFCPTLSFILLFLHLVSFFTLCELVLHTPLDLRSPQSLVFWDRDHHFFHSCFMNTLTLAVRFYVSSRILNSTSRN